MNKIMEAKPQGHPTPGTHGHEGSEINIKPLVLVMLGLGFSALLIHVTVWYLMVSYNQRIVASHPDVLPMAAVPQLPPEPRLETAPPVDAKQLRLRQTAALNSYGVADPKTKSVHIPIDRAMQLMVQRGKSDGRNWRVAMPQ